MRPSFTSLYCLFAIVLATTSPARGGAKLFPEYTKVDARVESIVKEYKHLAAQKNIYFKREVTIGFKKINEGKIVGLCHYGYNFREIDIDEAYWNKSTEQTRETLVRHELTHCLCGRGHDYAKDADYPENNLKDVINAGIKKFLDSIIYVRIVSKEGVFTDGCPLSIMYPSVVPDDCVNEHKAHYESEMYERCVPY